MMRSKRGKILSVIIIGLFILPIVGLAIFHLNTGSNVEEAHTNVTLNKTYVNLTLPFGKDSSLTLYVETRLYTENGTYTVSNMSIPLLIVEPGWPFTRAYSSGRIITIPTVLLALPEEFREKSFSAPVTTFTVPQGMCLPFKLHSPGLIYVGTTPGPCKSYGVQLEYRNDTGLLEYGSVFGVVGGSVYQDIISVVAWANLNRTVIQVPEENLSFCQNYYSKDIMYTMPGDYVYHDTFGEYLGCRIPDERPLLILYKSPDANQIWSHLLGNYTGHVLVVSPIMKTVGQIPYLEDVVTYHAVYILPDNTTIKGVESVSAFLGINITVSS